MKKLVFILLAVSLLACTNSTAPKPEHLLDKDEMADILYDIALLQSIKSYMPAVLDSNKVYSHNYIYKKYNIDSLTFAQNTKYYASDIETYEKIEKEVSERIKQEREKLSPADSLKNTQNPVIQKP